jgi:hypothetical protein
MYFKSNRSDRGSSVEKIKDSDYSNCYSYSDGANVDSSFHNISRDNKSENDRGISSKNKPTTNTNHNFSNFNGNGRSYSVIDRGFSFFSDVKQKHYDELNTIIFSKLITELKSISHFHTIGDSLPFYQSEIPIGSRLYKSALEHLKKENIDHDIDKFQKQLAKVNQYTCESGDSIKSIYETKLAEKNISETSGWIHKFIKYNLNEALKTIENEWEIQDYLENLPQQPRILKAEYLECLREILNNQEVFSSRDVVKKEVIELNKLEQKIQNMTSRLSVSIEKGFYYQDAECCPTLLTVVRRLFS